jgi:Ca-activated chloride channel homolog
MQKMALVALVILSACSPTRRTVTTPPAAVPQARIENENLPAPEAEPAEPKMRAGDAVAVAFVIDRSGSMTGLPMEMARDATIAAAGELESRDWVTVIAFDGQPISVFPMAQLDLGRFTSQVKTIQPGGGTEIFPALDAAYVALGPVDVKRKEAIVLTDGRAPTAGLNDLVDQMASEGIFVSTVGLGAETDETLLRDLATRGRGRYHAVADPNHLPRVFREELVAFLDPR